VVETGKGRLVITAAHCLPPLKYNPLAPWDQWEWTFPNVLAPLGEKPSVMVECLFVDPVSDLAVLGAPDSQELSAECDAYEKMMESAAVLSIAPVQTEVGVTFPGRLLSLKGTWFGCSVSHYGGPLVVADAKGSIVGGMSGSPLLNECGNAVGIVSCSHGSGSLDTHTEGGPNPRLTDSLPAWLVREIRSRG
jgi:hypothetical protein